MKTSSAIFLVGILMLQAEPVLALSPPRTLRERLALVRKNPDSPSGAGSLEMLEAQEGRKLTAEERAAFETTDAAPWQVFEDDLLRFEYPKHPLFTVTVVNKKHPADIQVVGGVASTADNSFERAYHLKAGTFFYGVIMVREADWFDEGICMCGSIAFKKCLLADGTALEFSLLDSGAVKKIQALGEKHRAILFEWTHSVVPQSAYTRLGGSLRFKQKSSRSRAEWLALSKAKRGVAGLASWLERGNTAEQVKALLGPPTRVEDDWLGYVTDTWRSDGSGFRTAVTIPLKNGVFDQVQDYWLDWLKLPPKAGTVAWAESRLDYWRSNEADEAKIMEARSKDLKTITELFLTQAKTATGDDWTNWTGVAHVAALMNALDPRVLELVLARYEEPGLSQIYSNNILDTINHRGKEALYEGRVEKLLKGKAGLRDHDELDFLLGHIDKRRSPFGTAVKTACSHPSSSFRAAGFKFAHFLTDQEALDVLKKGLDDEDCEASCAAASMLHRVVWRDHLGWLRERCEKEQDDRLKAALKDAIDAAEKRNGPYQ
jgi:hypothetical protein